MSQNVCKICRARGQKLFLKGEKCYSAKCSFIKKPYPPGLRRKKTGKALSEYARQLREKQKLKALYGLRENQFRNYVKGTLKRRSSSDASLELVRKLEKRFDNVIFRLGFARSRKQARQLVVHSQFLINSKPVNIPSYQLKKGEKISVKPNKKTKPFFKGISVVLKQFQPPSWLKLDKENLEAEVIGEPSFEDAGVPVEIASVFEFYSR